MHMPSYYPTTKMLDLGAKFLTNHNPDWQITFMYFSKDAAAGRLSTKQIKNKIKIKKIYLWAFDNPANNLKLSSKEN